MMQLAEDARFVLELRFAAGAGDKIFFHCVGLVRLQIGRQVDVPETSAAKSTFDTITPAQDCTRRKRLHHHANVSFGCFSTRWHYTLDERKALASGQRFSRLTRQNWQALDGALCASG